MNSQAFFSTALALTVITMMPSCIPRDEARSLNKARFKVDNLKNMKNIIPMAILGSGPAGLSAAVYGGRAGIQTVVFHGSLPGGLLTQTTLVENWPGQVEINGPDIIKNLEEQAQKWGVQLVQDTVERVDFTSWPYRLFTAEGQEINALSVIIATGATPRYLGVPGEKENWGNGVTTCAVCDAPFFKGLDVVVVGGGDSAAEEAMQLAPYAKNITILVRKESMRASKAMQDRLKKYEHISILYNREIQEIQGNGKEVTAIKLLNNKDKSATVMPISGVFLAIGHIPNTEFLNKAIALTEDGHVQMHDRTQATSVPGVFAAGDVEDDRYRQAGVAGGHGIAAALDATFFLNEIGYSDLLEQKLRSEGRLMQQTKAVAYEVMEINAMNEFETVVLGSSVPALVDFYAESCPSCMRMLPVFAATAQEFEDKARFVKVDADQADEIMKKYYVQKVPTLLIFKNGKMVARFATTMTKTELSNVINGIIEGK